MTDSTTAIVSEPPGIKLPMFTEVYGENRERERNVWINPAAVSHVVEYVPWHSSERRTLVHLTNGDTLQLAKGPIYVVTLLQLGRTNVLPPCIYCSDNDHWSQDCPTMRTAAAGLEEGAGR